jgi:hypothetical protein
MSNIVSSSIVIFWRNSLLYFTSLWLCFLIRHRDLSYKLGGRIEELWTSFRS